MVFKCVVKYWFENVECNLCEVFDGGYVIQYDGFVIVFYIVQEFNKFGIVVIDEEGVILEVDEVFVGELFDVVEVENYFVVGSFVVVQDNVFECEFELIVMVVQVVVLVCMVRDVVVGIEFELVCDGNGFGYGVRWWQWVL